MRYRLLVAFADDTYNPSAIHRYWSAGHSVGIEDLGYGGCMRPMLGMKAMHKRATRWTTCTKTALTFSLVMSASVAGGQTDSLISLIPDDVFLCVSHKHNSERDFIDTYWDEVLDALRESGVASDVMGLLSSNIPEGAQAEIDQFKEKVTTLIEGVKWSELGSKETVFAMRTPTPKREGSNFTVLPPDQLWLLRGDKESASKNYDGLVEIFFTFVQEVNKKMGMTLLQIEGLQQAEVRRTGIKIPTGPSGSEPMGVFVAVRDDIIYFSVGYGLLRDVLAVQAGRGTTKSLTESPRFKAAFAKLPAGEDGMVFFDTHRLVSSLRSIADVVFELLGSSDDVWENRGLSTEADALNNQALDAHRAKDYKQALALTKQAHEKAPKDSVVLYNLACFNALQGNKDEALTWLEKAVDGGCHAPKQMATDSDLDSLRDDPRYQKALALAKQRAGSTSQQGVAAFKPLVDRLFDIPGMIDFQATVEYTEGYSTHKQSITSLRPGADKMAFHPVIAKSGSIEAYDRYLPKETTSFAVSNAIDIKALYKFLVDTARAVGPNGEQILAQWAALQAQHGFDVNKDFLDWFTGDSVVVGMNIDGRESSVFMLRVSDEAKAREKLNAAIEFLSVTLKELATQNPMLAMIAVRTMPTAHEKLTGFQDLFVGMTPKPFTCGVADGHIILAQSAEAAALCLATAAGEHPNISKNSRLMSESLRPKGAVKSISYKDERQFGAQIATVLGSLSMAGQMATMMIPDPKIQQIAGKVLGMVAKLGTVATKLDFYKSSASDTTFDGTTWHTRSVTHYASPSERRKVAGQ